MNFAHSFLLSILLLIARYWFDSLHARADQISPIYSKRDLWKDKEYSTKYKYNFILYKLRETFKSEENEASRVYEFNPSISGFESRQSLEDFPNICAIENHNIRIALFSDVTYGYNLNQEHVKFLHNFSPIYNDYTYNVSRCFPTEGGSCKNNTKYLTIGGTCNNPIQRPEAYPKTVHEGSAPNCVESLIFDNTPRKNETSFSKFYFLPEPERVSAVLNITQQCNSLSTNLSVMLTAFGQFVAHDILKLVIDKYSKQMVQNVETSLIDGSQIYGSTVENNAKVREKGKDGKLKLNVTKVGQLPPNSSLSQTLYSDDHPNYTLPMVSLYVTFVRMHNLIADKLKELNSTWDDETLYQESRLINVFILQNIIFKEYLPLIVGPELVAEYLLDKDDTEQDNTMQLNIFHCFIIASFIINNTLPDKIYAISELGFLTTITVYNTSLDMGYIHQNGIENIIRGATRQNQKLYYPFLVKARQDDLNGENSSSSDLVVRILSYSRRYPVAGYVYYVFYLRGIRIKNFDDLFYYKLMESHNIRKLRDLYKFVEDIDLFTGLAFEKPLPGRILGETTAAILSIQFHRLKFGSRFIYTHKGMLNPDQKKIISSIKLSHVFCYANDMPQIADDVFNTISPIIRCDQIPPLDLSAWNEQPEDKEKD